MHGQKIHNVGQTKVKQKNNYALKKGKYMFLGFTKGITYIKMRKPRKKILLISSWEWLFLFMKYLDGNGFLEQDEGGWICAIKGKNE